jgi:hypothetical protein
MRLEILFWKKLKKLGQEKMTEEEFLPKWYADTKPRSKITENLVAITLLILLTIFTLGIVSGLQHTSDTIKGRN